jgi:UDP-N-acetylmuramoylalanine-D-glutamate ligase
VIVTMGQNGPRIAHVAGARGARRTLRAAPGAGNGRCRCAWQERALGAEGVVLLSPGAPSFPRYKDYVERGRHFANCPASIRNQISAITGLGVA